MPNDCLEKVEERVFYGGIYSWQPSKGQVVSHLLPYLARPARNQSIAHSNYEPLRGENVPAVSAEHAEPPVITMVRKSWCNQLISHSSLLLGLVTGRSLQTLLGLVAASLYYSRTCCTASAYPRSEMLTPDSLQLWLSRASFHLKDSIAVISAKSQSVWRGF